MRQGEVPKSSFGIAAIITKEQGLKAFWRGNMPHIYFGAMSMLLRVSFYDKIKNYWMPFHPSKYSGFDYIWRISTASFICTLISCVFTYPFDLVRTRICCDMSR